MLLATWEGGLDAYGALLGGTVGVLFAARRAKRSPWRWLDIAAPGAALGQAIARWGNWINQEQYGLPTSASWGLYIQPELRLPGYEAFERFQPLFAYESAWNLLVCLALLALAWRCRDRCVPGLIAGIYFISYATIRFLLEFLRLDRPMLAGLPVAQVVSLGIILTWAGVIWLFRCCKRQWIAHSPTGYRAMCAKGCACASRNHPHLRQKAKVSQTRHLVMKPVKRLTRRGLSGIMPVKAVDESIPLLFFDDCQ